jgi:DNA-binding MarR family transcriptional regulator
MVKKIIERAKIYIPVYMMFIHFIGLYGNITASRIGKEMQMGSGNLYPIKRYLLSKKIIEVTPGKTRREHPLKLTEKGIKLYNALEIVISNIGFENNIINYGLQGTKGKVRVR